MRLIISLFCCIVYTNCKSQQWNSFSKDNFTFIVTSFVDSTTGHIYVGGVFDSIYNIPAKNIAYYDGVNWHPLGSGLNSVVNSIISYKGEIYAAGNFDSTGNTMLKSPIVKWDGSSWIEIDTTVDLVNNFLPGKPVIWDMCVHNDKLFFCGQIGCTCSQANSDNFHGLGYFDGNFIYGALAPYILFATNRVKIESFMGDLYVVADVSVQDTCPGQASQSAAGLLKLDTVCQRLVEIGTWPNIDTYSLFSTDSLLYFGSNYASPIYGYYFHTYNGSSISPLAGGFNSPAGRVTTLNDQLIVTGFFTANYNNSIPINGIAQWNGTNWQDLPSTCLLSGGIGYLCSIDSLIFGAGSAIDSCGSSPVSVTVTYPNGFATSIFENEQPNIISLYPNPVFYKLTISCSVPIKFKLAELFSLDGKRVKYYQPGNTNLNSFDLDVSGMETGLYFLRLQTEKGLVTKKIVIGN